MPTTAPTKRERTTEQRAREHDQDLERAMRAILKLFAEGRLIYRERSEVVMWDVKARAARVRSGR